MKRAVIYTRVSSDRQVDNTSLDSQEATCRAHCERESWMVLRVFREEGASAKSDDRAQFRAMAAYCMTERVDFAVVYKLSRFARNAEDQLRYFRELAAVECTCVSVTEGLSSKTPNGRLQSGIMGVINQYANELNAELSRNGMVQIVRAGGWAHQAPVGYVTARRGRVPVLEPDPLTAPAVRVAFASVADGRSTVADARKRFEADLGRPVPLQTWHKLLRNRIYAGMICGPLTGGVSVQAAFDGLIAPDVFAAVQDRLARPVRPVRSRHVAAFHLRGALRCEAGHRMTASYSRGRWGGRYGYYHCAQCGQRAPTEDVDAALDVLLESVGQPLMPLIPLLREVVADVDAQERGAAVEARGVAEKKLATLTRRRDRLLEAYMAGDLNADDYRARADVLRGALDEARSAMAPLPSGDLAGEIAYAGDMLTRFGEFLRNADVEHRKPLIEAYFGDVLTLQRAGGLAEQSNPANIGIVNGLRKMIAPLSSMAPHGGCVSNPANDLIFTASCVADACRRMRAITARAAA